MQLADQVSTIAPTPGSAIRVPICRRRFDLRTAGDRAENVPLGARCAFLAPFEKTNCCASSRCVRQELETHAAEVAEASPLRPARLGANLQIASREGFRIGPTRNRPDKLCSDGLKTATVRGRHPVASPIVYRHRTLLSPSEQTTSTWFSILVIPPTSRSTLCKTCFK